MAAIFDPAAGEVRVYKDGAVETIPFLSPDASTDPLRIGHTRWGSYFKGMIEEPVIFQRVLTVEEINQLFNQ